MPQCGACGGTSFDQFFRAREWSTSGHYPSTPAPAPQPLSFDLEYCKSCGFIRQVSRQMVRLDYQEIERGTAKQLPDYAGRIIASLGEAGIGPDDFIVEVGANDGTFLKELHHAGFRNLLGVEPSRQLAEIAGAAGLEVRNDYFGRALAASIRSVRGPARAVVCRHTLEHVPDIRALTDAIADLLGPGGLGFIEVPDTDWVITQLFAHEIWDEHISYFRPHSLAMLLTASGLKPVRLERARFRDTRNLLCWSVRTPDALAHPDAVAVDEADIDSLGAFQGRWDGFAARLRARVAAAPGPIVAIGAAHIQLNFLNFAGLDGVVDMLVDDDPSKAGRFAPLARPVPIRTTADILATLRAGTLLRTAFPYPQWQDTLCRSLAGHGVGAIAPYEDLRDPK
jgi:2-polyprenyl-3-methyl-5-hydroxy-6-metoxy-1,4-benzoquinol methylase